MTLEVRLPRLKPRIVRWVGIGPALAFLPRVTIIGFSALGTVPTATALLLVQVVRRSSDVFGVSDPEVARALRFMADNSGRSLSIQEIATCVGLGRQALERRFRRHLGRTVNEELIRLRVSKLRRLLVESDDPVNILSEQSGFGTTVSMHTMFKRYTGITPGEYRKKHAPRAEWSDLTG